MNRAAFYAVNFVILLLFIYRNDIYRKYYGSTSVDMNLGSCISTVIQQGYEAIL